MKRRPDIVTSDLWWIPFTIDIPLGVNGSSFTLPGFDIESGTEGYIKTRDSGEWIQMYDRMLRLAEGRDNKTFSLGAYGDDNTWNSQENRTPSRPDHAAGAHCAKQTRLTSGGRLSSFAVLRRRRL